MMTDHPLEFYLGCLIGVPIAWVFIYVSARLVSMGWYKSKKEMQ